MRIGTVEIPDTAMILGPMAGVTDLPFRVLCREMGAALAYTEMVSAKAVLYKNKNTAELLKSCDRDTPLGLQLFGSEPDVVAEAAKILEEGPWQIIDFNMGCPVPKVVNNGEGSALMKNPKLAEEIITKMVKAVKKPVTVKIRKGFDEVHLNAVEMAKIAEASGAAAVAVHGRTREQYYAGKADWDCIRAVKEAVKIPVIGNGDVTDALSAERLLKETGCDGVMVGRAAQGNPFIFREITEYLETGVIPPKPTSAEVRAIIERHARMQMEEKGEYTGVREMRKHLSWYTVGYPNSAKYRQMINSMETMEELLHSLDMVLPKEA